MMNQELHLALEELERCTDALLESAAGDAGKLFQALERRASAITRVAALARYVTSEGPDASRRLNTALKKGNEVTRKVLAAKQSAVDDWNRLTRVARSIRTDSARSTRVGLDILG